MNKIFFGGVSVALCVVAINAGIKWWVVILLWIAMSIIYNFVKYHIAKARIAPMVAEYEKLFQNIASWNFIGAGKVGSFYVDPDSVTIVGVDATQPCIDTDLKPYHAVAQVGIIYTHEYIKKTGIKYAVFLYYLDPFEHITRNSGTAFGSTDYKLKKFEESDMHWHKPEPGAIEDDVYKYVMDNIKK